MKLFVFENVLTDYSPGMVLIAAKSLRTAVKYAKESFAYSVASESDGWAIPTAVYNIEDSVEPGVKEYCYGGG
jgi:hypothetical protein